MATVEQQLRDALTDFMRGAAERSPKVADALQRITALHQQLGPGAHPMLRHYLERRSYQKALDLLNTGVPENEKPKCGE